jgi:hypothetical protein
MAQVFRRLVQTIIDPAFREVAEFARAQEVVCHVECELGGVQPRAVFIIKPSGRSIRYELDPDGEAVREVEGVFNRPLGQRKVWRSPDEMSRQLTRGYARAAAAAIVQDHFQSAAREAQAPRLP